MKKFSEDWPIFFLVVVVIGAVRGLILWFIVNSFTLHLSYLACFAICYLLNDFMMTLKTDATQ